MKWLVDGDHSLLVFSIPQELAHGGEITEAYAIPIQSRRGGMLLALPLQALDNDKLIDAMSGEGDEMVGPSRSFQANLIAEGEAEAGRSLGVNCRFMVVDFTDDVLFYLRDYDASSDDPLAVVPYDLNHPQAIPDLSELPTSVMEWARGQQTGRAHFYSAREEPEEPEPAVVPKKAAARRSSTAALAEQLALLAQKVEAMAEIQGKLLEPPQAATGGGDPGGGKSVAAQRMPSLTEGLLGQGSKAPALPKDIVAKAAKVAGPPPKVRAPTMPTPSPGENPPVLGSGGGTQDPVLLALTQQSSAISNLVSHLTVGDPMIDLGAGSSTSSSSSTRGVQRREKLQGELAAGTSNFFVQVLGQMHRRMHPARTPPKTLTELQGSGLSMLQYLERFGGYKNQKGAGLTLWLVAHIVDAMLEEDFHKAQEHLALTICSLEQAALDQGDWSVAFLVSLVEEPPLQLFQDRMVSLHGQGRPFAPTMPTPWAAMILSYLKEMEVLTTRKSETSANRIDPAEAEQNPSPRRRQRYPKGPKKGAEEKN